MRIFSETLETKLSKYHMNIQSYLFCGIFFILLFSCTEETIDHADQKKVTEAVVRVDKLAQEVTEEEQQNPKQDITYVLIATADTLQWLKGLTGDSLQTILVLNRIDKNFLFHQDSLILPEVFLRDLDEYCPFPSLVDSIREINKIIYISRYAQLYAIYENGIRIKWGPTSTGKESTPTPSGLMTTNWKSKRKISTVDSEWILNWCFNISNRDGISLHEYALPGQPASHSCVRLYADDAKWIYYWADQWILKEDANVRAFGTPVIIFGEYPYGQTKPWILLALNSEILDISPQQLYLETAKYYDLIFSRQKTRIYVLEKQAEEKEQELVN